MSSLQFSKLSFIELHEYCKKGDLVALKEWKRRWLEEWPSIKQIRQERFKMIP